MIRIIGGEFRGRNILPSPGKTTRPMTSLIKKSLFDTLGAWFPGATVGDFYCGTGTLGVEALSRGADLCCFADRDNVALRLLRRNIATLGVVDKSRVWAGTVERILEPRLEELGRGLDVAFVDPPFPQAREWNWAFVAQKIFAPIARHLSPQGIVALRMPDDVEHPDAIGDLAVAKIKKYGGMKVLLLAAARELE